MRKCFITTYLVETALESSILLGTIVPFAIHDPEGDVLVRWSSKKSDQARVLLSRRCKGFSSAPSTLTDNFERRRLRLVDQVGVENIELVALNDFRWWVIMV